MTNCEDDELCIKDNRDESCNQFAGALFPYNMVHAKPLSSSYKDFIGHLKEAMAPPKVEVTAIMVKGQPVIMEVDTLNYLKSQGFTGKKFLENVQGLKGLIDDGSIPQTKIKIVKSLLATNKLNITEIAKSTGLSNTQVQEIKDGKHDNNQSSRIEELS